MNWFKTTRNRIQILSASFEGRQSAMVLTWIMQASLRESKPRIVIALSKKNFTTKLVLQSKQFSLNLLRRDQIDIAILCGLYSGENVDKFSKIAGIEYHDKLPYLSDSAGYATCTVIKTFDTGDRVLTYASIEPQKLLSCSFLYEDEFFSSLPANIANELNKKRMADELYEEMAQNL